MYALAMLEPFGNALSFLFVLLVTMGCICVGLKSIPWLRNCRKKRDCIYCKIVGRRVHVENNRKSNEGDVITKYYMTFETSEGRRLELQVSGKQYGLCMQGDEGQLTFQGIRYVSFQRCKQTKNTEVTGS